MGASRFVRPETCRLTLATGETLTIKHRLSHGDQRKAYARMYSTAADATLTVNPLVSGMAMVTAYLIDWSLTDDDDRPVAIRGLSADDLTAVLDNLEPEAFAEIRTAIEQHEAAMLAERAAKKKTTTPGADPISPSPFVSVGALSGSGS